MQKLNYEKAVPSTFGDLEDLFLTLTDMFFCT